MKWDLTVAAVGSRGTAHLLATMKGRCWNADPLLIEQTKVRKRTTNYPIRLDIQKVASVVKDVACPAPL
jgi:hypothetical protein